MRGNVEIEWGGETLTLLPQRALYWRRSSTLFITDPHFGKGATFRNAGMALPHGGTDNDLKILDEALSKTGAERLIILGDFFHTKSSQSDGVLESLATWRSRCQNLEITLVRGNHDRHAGAPPESLAIECVEDGLSLPPFVCYHEPVDSKNAVEKGNGRYRLCGHLHPVFTLRDRDGSSIRMPIFHFSMQQVILPAFGRFTGGYQMKKRDGDCVFLVGEECIVEV